MSSTVGPFGRQELLRAFFDPTWYRPDLLWIALTATVAVAGANGEDLDEVTAGGYTRMSIPVDLASWELSGYGEVTNLVRVDWPVATEDWGLVAGWALLDDPDTGNGYAVGSLVLPQTVVAGGQPYLEVGTITLALVD